MSLAQGTALKSIPRRRWRIAVLLGFGVLVNYFDRINLSVARDALHADFGITTVTFGYLLSAYSWTYAICQIPVGVLLDRFGVKKIGRLGAFIWSMASFSAAVSPGLMTLFPARLLLGIGESPTFPANAKAVGYWFPKRERSLATSIFDAAAKFASAIGVPLVGILLLHFGWRWSFAFTGCASFCYFVLFCALYKNPSEDHRLSPEERRYIVEGGAQPEASVQPEAATGAKPAGAPLLYLLTRRKVIGLSLGFSAYNYTFYLLLTWMPSYLSTTLGIDLLHSVFYASLPWLIATITDLFIGGLLVDRLLQRGFDPSTVTRVILVIGMMFGVGIFGVAGAHTAKTAVFWISFSLAGLAAAAPVAWSIPALIAPRESVGRIGGIVNFFSQVTAIAAPIITGYLVHATQSFKTAFIVAAVYLVIGIAAYAFLLGRVEPIPEPHPTN
jgi:MFS transporter, ACS family, D-galactonate transporter